MIKIQWLASIWRQNDQNIQNKAKLQKWSKSNELHRFDVKTIKMLSYGRKTFKTKLNYKSDQNPMTCIDLTSKLSKCWGTSQNIQNNAKLQNWSNYNELHRFDVKTIKKRKTTKSNQITMNCIDLTSNWQKCRVLSQNIQNQRKTPKVIKIQWLASIWC